MATSDDFDGVRRSLQSQIRDAEARQRSGEVDRFNAVQRARVQALDMPDGIGREAAERVRLERELAEWRERYPELAAECGDP